MIHHKIEEKIIEMFEWYNDVAQPGHVVEKSKVAYFYADKFNFIINEKQIATNVDQMHQHLTRLFNNENGTVHFELPLLDLIKVDNDTLVLRYIGYIYGSKQGDIKIYDMGIFKFIDGKIVDWKAVISAPISISK